MPHLIESLSQVHRAVTRISHLCLCWHTRWRSWKCKHLVERCLIGDEFDLDELRSRRDKLLATQVQPPRERGLAVVAQALRVGDGDEKQIKRRGARLAAIDEVPLHECLINPTELLGHLAQPLGPQYFLDCPHHDSR